MMNKIMFVSALLMMSVSAQDCPVAPGSFDANRDYFGSNKVSPSYYANGFDIDYFNSYKIVTGAYENATYVLYLCNTPVPTIDRKLPNPIFIQIPVSKVAITNPMVVSLFERLGYRSRIAAIMDSSLATTSCMQKRYNDNQVIDLSKVTDPAPVAAAMQGGLVIGGSYGAIPPAVPVLPFAGLLRERHPMARAEWMKLVGALFNEDARASEMWNGINDRYECTTFAVEDAKRRSSKYNPLSLWLNADVQTVTAASDTYSVMHFALQDAGTDNPMAPINTASKADMLAAFAAFQGLPDQTEQFVFDGTPLRGNGSTPLQAMQYTPETFLARFNLDPNDVQTARFWSKNNLYRADKVRSALGYDDFPISSVAHPDVLVADLAALFDPNYMRDYVPQWTRNVFNGNYIVATGDACNANDMDKPYVIRESTCPAQFMPDRRGKTVSVGAIVGATLGAIVGAVALGAAIWFAYPHVMYRLRRQQNRGDAGLDMEASTGPFSQEKKFIQPPSPSATLQRVRDSVMNLGAGDRSSFVRMDSTAAAPRTNATR